MALNFSIINIKDFLDPTILSNFLVLVLVLVMVYTTVRSNKIKNGTRFFLITAVVLIAWYLIILIPGIMGFYTLDPLFAPNIFFGFLILFHLLRKAYYSKSVQAVADKIPVPFIIGIQVFRLIGFVFLILWARGTLPAIFAFPAGIGDIIVGLTAPFVALLFYLKKPYSRKLAIWWNYLGIADLVIAISVGILAFSRPIPFIPITPTTELMSLFPLVMVPLDFLLHFLSLRVLKKNN